MDALATGDDSWLRFRASDKRLKRAIYRFDIEEGRFFVVIGQVTSVPVTVLNEGHSYKASQKGTHRRRAL